MQNDAECRAARRRHLDLDPRPIRLQLGGFEPRGGAFTLLDAPAGFRQFKNRLLDEPALSMLPSVSDVTLEFLKSAPVIKVEGDRLQDPHGMLR